MQQQAQKKARDEEQEIAHDACVLCHRPHVDPGLSTSSRLAVYTGYSNISAGGCDTPTGTLGGVQELRLEVQQMAATIAELRQEVQANCLKNSQSHTRTAARTKHSFAEMHARIDSVQQEVHSQKWVGQVDVALQFAQANVDMHHLRQRLEQDHHLCAHTNAALRHDQDIMLFHLYSQIGAYVGVTTARSVQEVQLEIAQKLRFLEQRIHTHTNAI
jgi:hypothetical protein